MPDRTARRLGVLAAVGLLAPLLILPVRALADVWRAPAVWPQQLGTRGIEALTSPATNAGPAVVNSLVVALATTVIAVVLAWPAARALATRRRGRGALLVVLAAPLLVPQFAVGTGMATWFLRWGLADSVPALVAAHLVYVLPYVVLLLLPGFSPRVVALEEAATVLGAPRAQRLRTVTLPAVAPALAVASLLGFVVSWSQYGTSLAVGGGRPLLPLVLLPFVGQDGQIAAALALVFLVPPLIAALIAARWARHR